MLKRLVLCLLVAAASPAILFPQNSPSPAAAKPTDHVVGVITAVDPSFKKLSVKEDKTGAEYNISLENTKTFLKVSPESKDLKAASRFNPSDLQNGDRVSVRGYKMDGLPNGVAAASILLMSARDLQRAHQSEMEAWQHSTAGVVESVDTATKQLKVAIRTPNGPQTMAVDGTNAEFTRYSPASPKVPVASQLSEVQPGDQIRVIGTKDENGSIITAQKIYSGSFRTVAGTITSISPDGKDVTVSDRRTRQQVQFLLTSDSSIKKLPPQAAAGLAQGAPGGSRDISQLLQSAPTINVSDLHPGQAVIASGGAGPNHSPLTATNIVVGVDQLLQSAAPRRGNHSSASSNDWNLDLAIPVE
ncbi:MAG TPA: hypothetical protein VLJ11_12945 [Bryobacteraceae bacterium]|nr:hypothetical protein [Bryobacteraceae bacterium]